MPDGKGWHSWPYGTVERYDYALNVYSILREWQRLDAKKQGEWIKKNERAFELIIAPLMEMNIDG